MATTGSHWVVSVRVALRGFRLSGVRPDPLGASLSRAGATYATGVAIPIAADSWQLVLTRHLHSLRPGRYTLTLRGRHGARRILERRPITIT